MRIEGRVGETVAGYRRGLETKKGSCAGIAVVQRAVGIGESIVAVQREFAPTVTGRQADRVIVRAGRFFPGVRERIGRAASRGIGSGSGRIDVGDAAILGLESEIAGE